MLGKKGKLLLVVLLALSLALMVGCDALSDVDDGSGDDSDLVWEDYYSHDFEFGIKYPPEWSLEDFDRGIRLADADEDEVILYFDMVEEFADQDAAEDAFEDIGKDFYQDEDALNEEYDKVINYGEVTINGQDAYEVEFEDDAYFFEGDERVRGKRILTYKGDYLYVLEYEVIKDKYEQHENLLAEIVDSIQLDAEGTLPVSEGTDFRITALTVEPETVIAGVEGLEVTAEVQNYGDEQDEQDIVIKLLDEDGEIMTDVDGEMKEIIDTISLKSRESESVKFIDSTFPEIESGNYTIKVASEDDSDTVGLKVVTSLAFGFNKFLSDYGADYEYMTLDYPAKYGYPVKADERWEFPEVVSDRDDGVFKLEKNPGFLPDANEYEDADAYFGYLEDSFEEDEYERKTIGGEEVAVKEFQDEHGKVKAFTFYLGNRVFHFEYDANPEYYNDDLASDIETEIINSIQFNI